VGLTALLVAAAVVVGWLGDIRMGSGSDAGGKLATARVMAEGSTCDPDIGWWAADVDPDGTLHQIFHTEPVGDRYVQATSPVYQCLVMPLQRALGPWGPVAVSIAGAAVAALAAASIARRLGADDTSQALAFVLVGILGPVFHYATDVWEHAPALGLLLLGVALVLGPATLARAAGAGLCFGAAFALRAETVVYVVVLAGAGVVIGEVRRRWLAKPLALVAGGVAAAAVVGANLLAERAILATSIRAERSSTLAEGSGGELGERIRTALVTGFGFLASDDDADLLLGVAVVAVLLVGARAAIGRRDAGPTERWAGAIAAARWAYGPGFVPGVFPAAPLAVAGVWSWRRSADHRWLVIAALAAMPVVWLVQWPGLLVAQWGGRYLLATGAILTAVACSTIVRRAAVPLLVSCAAIGLMSAVWHVQRTAAIGRVVDAVEAVPEDTVVVTFDVNLGREAGGTYGSVRWLAVGSEEQARLAADVLDAHRPANLTIVRRNDQEGVGFPPYEVVGTDEVRELGNTWHLERLVRR
jgi:hypothetical protein